MWAGIMARVCGHEFASEPASRAGRRRRQVRGQDYPGLRAAPGGSALPARAHRFCAGFETLPASR